MKAGILLIIVALLLVLYIMVVFVVGGRDDLGLPLPIDMESVTLDNIRGRLTRTMTSDQITPILGGPACQVRPDQLLVSAETTCLFELEPSTQWTRKLTLAFGPAVGAVELEMTQPNALSINETLAAGQGPIGLDIFKNEDGRKAQLTISNCRGLPATEDEAETAVCALLIAE
jgi:hypothetical protein